MQYGQFGPKHHELIQKGLSYFNQGFYWECHEELEDHWLEDRGDHASLVYWVIIQVSTALYHWSNGNQTGARSMMNKAQEKLVKMRGKGIEGPHLEKIGWQAFVDLLGDWPEDDQEQFFRKLKEFRFVVESV